MCTISWLYQSNRYHVFFNRDEQLTRANAQPPHYFSADNSDTDFIMPIDPVGGGSWLSTNGRGLSIALLNYYQGRIPKGPLRSRGKIVTSLAGLATRKQMESALSAIPLHRYAPFSLLIFEPVKPDNHSKVVEIAVPLWCWDGQHLGQQLQYSPLISSGKLFEQVHASRLAIYRQKFERKLGGKREERGYGVADFYALHRDHGAGPSALSICMHRADAATVSFSHVEVGVSDTVFRYWQGPSCEQANFTEEKLAWSLGGG